MDPAPVVQTPATTRSSEDLPQPLGPTTSKASSGASVRLRFLHSSRPDSGVCTASLVSTSSSPEWGVTTERSMVPTAGRPPRISFISRMTSSAFDVFRE